MAHTPGPWQVFVDMPLGTKRPYYRLEVRRNTPNGMVILADLMQRNLRKPFSDEQRANAALIAAAPELLEACKLALADYEAAYLITDGAQARSDCHGRIAILKTAIARAEGK